MVKHLNNSKMFNILEICSFDIVNFCEVQITRNLDLIGRKAIAEVIVNECNSP